MHSKYLPRVVASQFIFFMVFFDENIFLLLVDRIYQSFFMVDTFCVVKNIFFSN